jgi:hypothetical protein
MGDPFGLRDDACWECIIRELRKANQSELADELQEALNNPLRQDQRAFFENMNPAARMSIDPAASTCRHEGKCQW